jgi:hypothetical protein
MQDNDQKQDEAPQGGMTRGQRGHASSRVLPFSNTLGNRHYFFSLMSSSGGPFEEIASFLSSRELARFSQINREIWRHLESPPSLHVWKNIAKEEFGLHSACIEDKRDIAFWALFQRDLNYYVRFRYGNVKQERLMKGATHFAKQSIYNAHRALESPTFSPFLPIEERTLPRTRSTIRKLCAALFLGGLSLILGVLMAAFYVAFSAVSLCVNVLTGGYVTRSSFLRQVLGVTLMPIYAISQAIYLGGAYGWKYGMSSLEILCVGLCKAQDELFSGPDQEWDPWSIVPNQRSHYSCFDPAGIYDSDLEVEPTDILDFFEESHISKGTRTVAALAALHPRLPLSLALPLPPERARVESVEQGRAPPILLILRSEPVNREGSFRYELR